MTSGPPFPASLGGRGLPPPEGVRVCAIVPAAGSGERMGSHVPKQYMQVCGSPLVLHCLRAISRPTWIRKVVLTVDNEERAREILDQDDLPKVLIVKGRSTRHRSILEGLKALKEERPEVVVIHDGVRPIVPEDILSKVVTKAYEIGAAGVVRPLVSTILVPDDGARLQTVPCRSSYRNSEMPQAFNYQMILQSYQKCSNEELDNGTECLAIALNQGGVKAYLVEGTSDLWKITYPEDIQVAQSILSKHILKVCLLLSECSVEEESEASGQCKRIPTLPSAEKSPMDLKSFLSILETDECSRKTNNHACLSKRCEVTNVGDIILCKNSTKIVTHLSLDILNHSSTSHIATSTSYLDKNNQCLISICCILSVSDAERVLRDVNSFIKETSSSLIAIFDTSKTKTPEADFLSLKRTVLELFPNEGASVLIVILTPNSKHNHLMEGNSKLKSLLEQCLRTPFSTTLHGQILFL